MAGAPAGFDTLINRKYDIQQDTANSESALRAAQAKGITGALSSENKLRNAQAYQATETGSTIAPTAAANIASTYAQIPGFSARDALERSQAGYYDAEAGATRFNSTDPASIAERTAYWTGRNTLGNYGLGSGTTQGVGTGNPGLSTQRSVIDPYMIPPAARGPTYGPFKPDPGANPGQLYSGGTDDVEPIAMDPMNAYSRGTARVPGQPAPQGAPMMPSMPGGTMPPGLDFHTVMAHAMHSLANSHAAMHASGGATTVQPMPTVPAPGQTTTNGTWAPPDNNAPNGQNQTLRASMGMGKPKAAGGATTVVAPPTPSPPAPGQTQTNGTWGGQNQGLRTQLGMGPPLKPKAAGGAANVMAANGMTKIPGKGPGNVDKVPATLAPGEAVLNKGAADHMGRGAIAALNALGAAKMAAMGAPPAPPQSSIGGGAPMPMGMGGPPMMGAPAPKGTTPGGAPKPSAKPMAKASPKPAAKMAPGGAKKEQKPAPKVAAGGKR